MNARLWGIFWCIFGIWCFAVGNEMWMVIAMVNSTIWIAAGEIIARMKRGNSGRE